MPVGTQAERLLRHARERGPVRARDLERLRIRTAVLTRLVRQGHLIRRSHGVYTAPEHEPTEHTGGISITPRTLAVGPIRAENSQILRLQHPSS